MDRETVTIEVVDLMTFPSTFDFKLDDFYASKNKIRTILHKFLNFHFQF